MWRGVDEADGVIVMVSDWLELDAADDWVRHDSEIVSTYFYIITPHISPLFVLLISEISLFLNVT